MLERSEAPAGRAEGRAGGRVGHAVRAGLTSIAAALAAQLAPEQPSGGWLSRVHPQAALLGAIALIVALSLVRQPAVLAAGFLLSLGLALSAGLPARRLLTGALGVFAFSMVVLLPAALNVITPGRELLVLWPGSPGHGGPAAVLATRLAVTAPGLWVVARLLLRGLACVTLALALTASTRPTALVRALRDLGMPAVFGSVLVMMQRYLVVLLRMAEDLHLARLSRALGPMGAGHERRWLAGSLGWVFQRSLRLAEAVHDAMRARGYEGEPRCRPGPGWRWADRLLVAAAAAACLAFICVDRLIP